MRKLLGASMSAVLMASLIVGIVAGSTTTAVATPVATDVATYTALGRVFPDPHASQNDFPGKSPYAKGRVPATDFLQVQEVREGLEFLEETFPKFSKFHVLHRDFECSGKPQKDGSGCAAFKSAGLPVATDDEGQTFVREKRPLWLFRATDERPGGIPIKKRKHFVFPLSLHGIERAGVEGGTRAAEDLVTWGACQAGLAPAHVDPVCDREKSDNAKKPFPLLEASPRVSIGTAKALKRSVIYFAYVNPDGWLRGDRFRDRVPGANFYQRYNGNGVDLNRDWPTRGFTFRPYTPWSEPESRAFGRVLRNVGPRDKRGKPKWDGGIDLHGQIIDRAFSFTLLGAGEHSYHKNQRILQLVKGAWKDAENRLGYSPIIKPNEAPQSDPRVYGVQWGTVWDTIDYTITGGIGDWINSPIGLNGDGIDNEMSLSHLGTCGVGSCFEPDFEQLHVDGNKSLIYSMVNYALKPEKKVFRTKGRVGYVFNPKVVSEKSNPLKAAPKFTKLPKQPPYMDRMLDDTNDYTTTFRVKGPRSTPRYYNGGIEVKLTCATSPVSATCEATDAYLERRVGKEPEPGDEPEWETVNSYFLQGLGYAATGKALHANFPKAGQWRVRLEGATATDVFDADINFTKEKGWNDPGQIGFKATNMRFWSDLKPFAKPGVEKLTVRRIKNTNRWKRRYSSIVISDSVFKSVAGKLKKWVAKKDGNLVLLDKGMKMLEVMGLVNGGINTGGVYAGYVNFETSDREPTYGDPLARKINQPGAAEGGQGETDELDEEENHRHQTYEPVPIGYAIQDPEDNDMFVSPYWFVNEGALKTSKGKGRAVGTTEELANVSLGEIKYQGGTVRFLGAVLPMPTKKYDNPFGVDDHALTYSGYQLMKNLLN